MKSTANQSDEQLLTFRISDLKAAQLRKGVFFNPDPYLKISIISNENTASTNSSSSNSFISPFILVSNQTTNIMNFNNLNFTSNSSDYLTEYKTYVATNTCFPHWKNEVKNKFC